MKRSYTLYLDSEKQSSMKRSALEASVSHIDFITTIITYDLLTKINQHWQPSDPNLEPPQEKDRSLYINLDERFIPYIKHWSQQLNVTRSIFLEACLQSGLALFNSFELPKRGAKSSPKRQFKISGGIADFSEQIERYQAIKALVDLGLENLPSFERTRTFPRMTARRRACRSLEA